MQLVYFSEFIQRHGGGSALQGLTPGPVCSRFIEAECRKSGGSICEQMRLQSSGLVGKPSWFISHTWGYQFLDTVEAIRVTLERVMGGDAAASDVAVWFDLFSLEQSGCRDPSAM